MMGDESLSFPDDVLDQHIVTLFERLEGLRRSQTNKEARPLMQLEIRSLEFWRAIFAECVGSFFYVFIVCGAAAGAGLGASTSAVLLASALASGLAMGMLTHSLSHISGRGYSHLNLIYLKINVIYFIVNYFFKLKSVLMNLMRSYH